MMSEWQPTCDFRWFRCENGRGDGLRPMAKIEGNEWYEAEWFVLKQRWTNADPGKFDQWRDIEVVPLSTKSPP